MDLDYKTAYAAQEAAQERAAYEAKMRRDDVLAREARVNTYTPRYTRWELNVMREAKAVRDADGDPMPYLDANLARAEAQFAARKLSTATDPGHEEPTRGRGGYGATTGGAANGPSEAQLRFLGSLCTELGWVLGADIPIPADKRAASKAIDQAKVAVDALRRSGKATATTGRPATERQRELIANLLTERVYDAEVDVEALNTRQASELIDSLFAAPRAARAAHGIREGYYAYTTDGGTTADHYHVRRSGRIVVWTAGGEHPYSGKLNEGLEWVKANPREAAELFGRLVGTCGRCGRVLSDDDSRARGLGPVCAGKTEW